MTVESRVVVDPTAQGRQFATRANDATAQALAARVSKARSFASKAEAVALFDQEGHVIGTADPSKVQKPDGAKLIAAFDQAGQFLGLVAAKDVTGVQAQPPAGQNGQPASGQPASQSGQQARSAQPSQAQGQRPAIRASSPIRKSPMRGGV